MISILGDRAANVDITWYHWPCNINITKNQFYMAARIDKIIISELAATELRFYDMLTTFALGLREFSGLKVRNNVTVYLVMYFYRR